MCPRTSKRQRVVVDGSNIATEGRSAPSLAQLDEAIRTFLDEHPGFTTGDVTVVVDATFGHRIDASEQADFEQALEHGEMLTPPAGAIGRGDGFILRIAEKSDAVVLSNDSFQEFHAERPWLFDPGRLIGGKPVPGIGWVFTPRTPVRGPRSRSVTARSKRELAADEADEPVPATSSGRRRGSPTSVAADTSASTGRRTSTRRTAASDKTKPAGVAKSGTAVKAARTTKTQTGGTAAKSAAKSATGAKTTKKAKKASQTSPTTPTKRSRATKEASAASPRGVGPEGSSATPSRSGSRPAGGNDPVTFLNFVADHAVGSTMTGTVVAFTSHGAHVDVDGMQCHVPLRGLGDPPPQRARQVLAKGETRQFVLVSLDAAHRRAELALAD
jgi:Zc3h12a-like ribonuclease protein